MVPFFRAGRVADGILATTELIVMRAQRAAANAGFEDEAWAAVSGGAGATAPADLNAGPVARRPAAGPRPAAGTTPGATLQAYFKAMDRRDDAPDLAIYTPATRDMLRGWVVTPAQMDTLVKSYRRCHPEPVRFGPGADLAVIRYPVLGTGPDHDAERDPLRPDQRLAFLAGCGPPLPLRVRGLAFRSQRLPPGGALGPWPGISPLGRRRQLTAATRPAAS
jgi:hypothetical protein